MPSEYTDEIKIHQILGGHFSIEIKSTVSFYNSSLHNVLNRLLQKLLFNFF